MFIVQLSDIVQQTINDKREHSRTSSRGTCPASRDSSRDVHTDIYKYSRIECEVWQKGDQVYKGLGKYIFSLLFLLSSFPCFYAQVTLWYID